MLAKLQYTVQDWLDLHDLESREALEYCSVIIRKFQTDGSSTARTSSSSLSFSLEQSLEYLVLPALSKLLGQAALQECDLSKVKLIQQRAADLDPPFTEWNGKTNAPAIHLVWSGTADDLVCLTHEMAHAVQMILSKGVLMPPIVRETCAFLGELALIQYSKTKSRSVYHELQAVWRHENRRYLGTDVIQLANKLKNRSLPYHYRQNYPFARIRAMSLFVTHGTNALRKLFANGSDAMDALKLQETMHGLLKRDIIHTGSLTLTRTKTSRAFRMSLSLQALHAVRAGNIDYAWLFHPASAGYIVENRVEDIVHLPAQFWIKWRSLGVFALAALNHSEADILPSAFLEKYERVAAQFPELRFSTATPWVQPLQFDAVTALGMTIRQLATSPPSSTVNRVSN